MHHGMNQKQIYSMCNGTYIVKEGFTPPIYKANTLTTRYNEWWNIVGHRQNLAIIEFYEVTDTD